MAAHQSGNCDVLRRVSCHAESKTASKTVGTAVAPSAALSAAAAATASAAAAAAAAAALAAASASLMASRSANWSATCSSSVSFRCLPPRSSALASAGAAAAEAAAAATVAASAAAAAAAAAAGSSSALVASALCASRASLPSCSSKKLVNLAKMSGSESPTCTLPSRSTASTSLSADASRDWTSARWKLRGWQHEPAERSIMWKRKPSSSESTNCDCESAPRQ